MLNLVYVTRLLVKPQVVDSMIVVDLTCTTAHVKAS